MALPPPLPPDARRPPSRPPSVPPAPPPPPERPAAPPPPPDPPPPGGTEARSVEVTNPSDGGFFYWLLRFYAFGLCCVLGLALLAGIGVYFHFAGSLPPIPDLATYHEVAATTTVMRAWDGTPLAELANERREILPFDRFVGSSRVDLQACKLEYSIVSPK